jgi:hypothetical protein
MRMGKWQGVAASPRPLFRRMAVLLKCEKDEEQPRRKK